MQVILFTDVADTLGHGKYAGTYKIATEIRRAGYTCQVIDLFSKLSYNELERAIDKFVTTETILIGFSCTLMEKRIGHNVLNFGRPDQEVDELMSYAKRKNSKIKVVVGGARITTGVGWHFVDYAIVNKGDIAIIKLIEHLLYGTNLPAISTSPVIIIDGSSKDYYYTQDDFAKSQIKFEKNDIVFNSECLPIEVARGCIFSCAFCHFDLIGKKIGDWQRTEDSLREEMYRNYELFGTTSYMVSDELINESLPKMELIHKVFTSMPFKVTYTSYARLDMIYAFREMRELLLESGAISLAFGIETMNDNTGKKIGKGLGKAKTKETLKYVNETWRGKILTSSQFIAGLPYETEESLNETVEWLLSDECPLDVFGFLPLFIRPKHDGRSSSKIDQDPKKYGYIVIENEPWRGDQMDFQSALRFVMKFYSDPRVQKRTKFSAATWVGRLLNLGYTLEELFSMIRDENRSLENTKIEMTARMEDKKNLYYNELMKI